MYFDFLLLRVVRASAVISILQWESEPQETAGSHTSFRENTVQCCVLYVQLAVSEDCEMGGLAPIALHYLPKGCVEMI